MKIGLFFGSFNPIHTGHLIIANYMAHYTDLEQVWFIVSPHNPLKDKNSLINMYDRLEMCRLATDHSDKLSVSDFEFSLPRPSYTIDTLTHLKERYPGHEFSLIMGADSLVSLKKWKNYELILRDYSIFVYPRRDYTSSELFNHPSVTLTETPLMEISSTFIRKSLKANLNVQFFVPDAVLSFIEAKSLYK